jgi:hypothetical protein
MSDSNVQKQASVSPEACDLPKTKLEYKSDGLTDYRIKESTNLNILEAVKAIQVTNNTSLARGQDKMLDNTVKIDKIETD